MGAHSTLRVTRTKAKLELMKYFLSDITDKKLEDFMDSLLDERLYNAVIVHDDAPNDDGMV